MMVSVAMEDVMGPLRDMAVSQGTVATLQHLLGLESVSSTVQTTKGTVPGRTNTSKLSSRPTRLSRNTASRTQRAAAVAVSEDIHKPLPPREKYALATQTVNAGLKILTEAARASAESVRSSRDEHLSTSATAPRGALKPRSNNITPMRSSPKRSGSKDRSSSTNDQAIVATAECTHLAFAFLRSVDTQKLGVREMPRLQLETGMLALAGKLISLNLDSLAVKELRQVKRRLESIIGASKENGKAAKMSMKARPSQPERETLASLLRLDAQFGEDAEVLSLAATYCMHSLRLIALSSKPAVIEEAAQYLDTGHANSPVDLLRRQAKAGTSPATITKQLAALSHAINSLCPSPSASGDAVAIDQSKTASPDTTFKLQMVALQAHTSWWDMVGHQADVEKELLEPFLQCASALVRRSAAMLDAEAIYTRLAGAFEQVCSAHTHSSHSVTLYSLHGLLALHAKQAGKRLDALHWGRAAKADCKEMPIDHARRVSAEVRCAALVLDTEVEATEQLRLDATAEVLGSKLSGSVVDFDHLLASMRAFAVSATAHELSESSTVIIRRLLVLAADFAIRYARSYPGRGNNHVTAILHGALRVSKSTDDLLSWITAEAATAFIQAGATKRVAEVASRRPLAEAWTASSDASALSRICRVLLLSRVRSSSRHSVPGIIDDESLPTDERGALLELQLDSAMQLTSKAKYIGPVREVCSSLLKALACVYTVDAYPIRRVRVAIRVLRLHETLPGLLSPEELAHWSDAPEPEEDRARSDCGLLPYLHDMKAALHLSIAFSKAHPSFDELKPSITSWSRIVSTSGLKCIDDPSALSHQLRMTASYLSMRGEDQSRLPVSLLLERVEQLRDEAEGSSHTNAVIELARSYLELGHAEKAQEVLDNLESKATCSSKIISCQLMHAEEHLSVDDLEQCHRVLVRCQSQREQVQPDSIQKDQRRAYELIHAQAWLMSSKYASESGSRYEALAGAKHSVKILNSMWAALERTYSSETPKFSDEAPEASESGVDDLAKGVKKLQLTPKDDASSTDATRAAKGAAFWPLVPMLTKALTHLSDMYSHHGLFSEANYYSERATSIAESVRSTGLLSRIRSHRAKLLALAGRLEEAELCLVQDEAKDLSKPSLAAVERLHAEATLRTKEGSFEEGLQKLEQAQQMLSVMSSGEFLAQLERFDSSDGLSEIMAASTLKESKAAPLSEDRPTRAPAKRLVARSKANKPVVKKAQPSARPAKEVLNPCYILSKMEADIVVQLWFLKLKLGQNISEQLSEIMHVTASATLATRRRVAQHLHLMTQATAELESDVTMNVLLESSLSLPAFANCEGIVNGLEPSSQAHLKTVAKSKCVSTNTKPSTQNKVVGMLQVARDCILAGDAANSGFKSTVQMHWESSVMAKSSMLLSAVCTQQHGAVLHPVQEGLSVDLPRMEAMQYEKNAMSADRSMSSIGEPLSWPTVPNKSQSRPMTPLDFQANYIDIIPKPWTAVSLSLNDDASELYITRYRSDQQPLILRLPFSRHKPDDVDEEAFDYTNGKAELREIIDLSNYTCHSSGDTNAKGAKSTWWNDREALDQRMHELLTNMENIWFGGFKSIFAQDRHNAEVLGRFRKCFEDVLCRYLPSRQAAKSKGKKLALDDKVFELFIGLGHDQDGVIDLDEPLADLLYFVVDMLQFSGERNAYDEIDFDSMAVDVLDAMRSYHEVCQTQSRDAHLILVLDRRLQAFPWESMPCLQDRSVSRVGSMQSLRECIVAMRTSTTAGMDRLPHDGEGCHVIERISGTYILNPSTDLRATQTLLAPALQSLKDDKGQPWSSIVNEAPDEQRFSSALQKSSVMLYFGHGAGSQYIRPRAVKRLEKCSEVVWLMGCSSGAVTENGDLEPTAVPHAYLLAGGQDYYNSTSSTGEWKGGKCLSVLATLWDVTDKDIDRFSLAVGEKWGLWSASAQSQLPTKSLKKHAARQIVAAPSTPQQVPKMPKTPKARKTPAAKTAARVASRNSSGGGMKKSLVQAVASSREVCYLRYLNGAAAVVYGVPVYIGD